MTIDPRRGDVAVVARADIARLTLRLRAAQREAAEAEAAATADPTAVAELEARLAPLVQQRRDALTVELERVRDEALQAIADARRQADDVLARFAPPAPAAPPVPAVPQPPAAAVDSPSTWITPAEGVPIVVAAPLAAALDADPSIDSVWAPSRPVAPVETPPVVTAPPASAPADAAPAAPGVPAPTVLIDAEAFARVFASMIAQVIDERDRRPGGATSSHEPVPPMVQPQYVQAPYVQPHIAQPQIVQPQIVQPQIVQPQVVQPQMMPVQPVKQGFWATARHLDVMLLGTTMVIALVILAAWLA